MQQETARREMQVRDGRGQGNGQAEKEGEGRGALPNNSQTAKHTNKRWNVASPYKSPSMTNIKLMCNTK
jgi:hypothetical protein